MRNYCSSYYKVTGVCRSGAHSFRQYLGATLTTKILTDADSYTRQIHPFLLPISSFASMFHPLCLKLKKKNPAVIQFTFIYSLVAFPGGACPTVGKSGNCLQAPPRRAVHLLLRLRRKLFPTCLESPSVSIIKQQAYLVLPFF